MRTKCSRTVVFAAISLFLTLFPENAFADAICLLASCPGAPLSSPFPGPISVFEGQNILLALPVVPGDTLLYEDAALTIGPGDLLRFFSGGPIFLFSDNPGTEPPDTGIPPFGTNIFSMFEGPAVPIVYTAGLPGAQNTYLIFSDFDATPDVPEPGTVILIGTGLITLVLRSRNPRVAVMRNASLRKHGTNSCQVAASAPGGGVQ